MNTKYCAMLTVIASLLFFGLCNLTAQETTIDPSSEIQKMPINSASFRTLQELPEVTPEIAVAILKGRPYAKAEDLLNVPGIDESKLAQIEPLIEIDKLNINYATLEEMLVLPGVNLELAEKIVKSRPYTKVEDLLLVDGFPKEVFEKLQEYVEATLERKSRSIRGRTTNTRSVPAAVVPTPAIP